MDIFNKRLRDEIIALRKSIDAIRDQQERQHEQEQAQRELPLPSIRVEAETHETKDAEGKRDAYNKSQIRVQWVTAIATSAAFLAAAIYAGLAAYQLRTMNNTYSHVREQTVLARQQIVGTMAAVIVSDRRPEVTENLHTVTVEITNEGHVVSPHVRITLERSWISLPSFNIVSSNAEKFDVVQLPPGGEWHNSFTLSSQLPAKFDPRGNTLTVQGTVNFDNGFGERFDQPFCFTYIAHADLNTPEGEMGVGPNFVGCEVYKAKFETWKQYMKR